MHAHTHTHPNSGTGLTLFRENPGGSGRDTTSNSFGVFPAIFFFGPDSIEFPFGPLFMKLGNPEEVVELLSGILALQKRRQPKTRDHRNPA